jgi:glycosyltransferase involved in cell wall biosynthesis
MTDREPGAASAAPSDATPTPLVTAVVTTYDRPTYLRTAVRSVCAQTYGNVELVVVDDHSPTPAAAALEDVDMSDLAAVRFRRHGTNRGANAARNTGIEAASGEYVAFLDDDDRWVPAKLERQVEGFRTADEDVGVVYAGRETVGPDGRDARIPPRVEDDLTRALLCRNVVGTLSVVMARTDLARAVPLDEAFPAWADLEWYVRLSRRTTFRRLPAPLTVYEFTSHGRLSEDVERKVESYELFLERFEPVAREYGRLFRRKMRAWAAFRVGKTALATGDYDRARRFVATAVATYPFEPAFLPYVLGTLGGRLTHDIARRVKRLGT